MIAESIAALSKIDGLLGFSLADVISGRVLEETNDGSIGIKAITECNNLIIKVMAETLANQKPNNQIIDIIITLGKQYHIIRRVESLDDIYVHLVLDRHKTNLGMARRHLIEFEQKLKASQFGLKLFCTLPCESEILQVLVDEARSFLREGRYMDALNVWKLLESRFRHIPEVDICSSRLTKHAKQIIDKMTELHEYQVSEDISRPLSKLEQQVLAKWKRGQKLEKQSFIWLSLVETGILQAHPLSEIDCTQLTESA